MTTNTVTAFSELALKESILQVLNDVGYETPSPIQAKTIPLLLNGNDVLGQAQTGTGKTAAFALPILSGLDLNQKEPQVLVLAPTRELAIQVAEAFQTYAKHLQGFHVLPVYGGQEYRGQIRALNRGVHVIVGTPGRVMDHMRKGTLKLNKLSTLVLDEADEMLRMGFIDDVEWILEKTPADRQIALFSATMPAQIRRIASKYLNKPVEVIIKVKTATAETIRQRFWSVSGMHKLDALTRILEAEPFDAMLIFVRTKTATVELTEKLEARGYAASPLNGDIPQNIRERTVENLKNGKLDIVVATDVAARGLDVQRVSHVINYDIPYDTEAYIHRIGRTGRAGRQGDAILFVTPREKRLLYAIEKATRKKIEIMDLPSTELINDNRVARFKQRITDTLATENSGLFYKMVEQYQREHDIPALEIAAALAQLLQGDAPFLLQNKPQRKSNRDKNNKQTPHADNPGNQSGNRSGNRNDHRKAKQQIHGHSSEKNSVLEKGMERFRIEVGRNHSVKPGNIVGAIANEAGLDSQYIGHINIQDDYSLIDLPEDMPKDIFNELKHVWVSGQQLKITHLAKEKRKKSSGNQSKDKDKNKIKGKASKTSKKNTKKKSSKKKRKEKKTSA